MRHAATEAVCGARARKAAFALPRVGSGSAATDLTHVRELFVADEFVLSASVTSPYKAR